MSKTHFTLATKPEGVYSRFLAPAVCGREAYSATSPSQVTCLNCKKQPEFEAAQTAAMVAAAEEFANQTPATVRVQWTGQNLACRSCGYDQFRSNGRTLDHFQYVCARCGETSQVLTETGMSA